MALEGRSGQDDVDFGDLEERAMADLHNEFDEMHAMLERAEARVMGDVDVVFEEMDRRGAVWTTVVAVMEQACWTVTESNRECGAWDWDGAMEVTGEMETVLDGLKEGGKCVGDAEMRMVTSLDDTTNIVRAEILRHCVERHAERGDYFQAGLCCLNSDEFEEAQEWFDRCEDGVVDDEYLGVCTYGISALHGDEGSLCNIGSFYTTGYVFYRNEQKGFAWQEKAAEKGSPAVKSNIANAYRYGTGVERNYEKAFEWHMKAAKQGFVLSETNIGIYYENGMGTTQDKNKALEWYMKAAKKGNNFAQFYLGNLLFDTNSKEAFGWYTKAGNQGLLQAFFMLGIMNANGIGTPRNESKALELFAKTAKYGHPVATAILQGVCRLDVGDSADESERLWLGGVATLRGARKIAHFERALKMFEAAAVAGHPKAASAAGWLNFYGEGVRYDYERSVWFLERAAESGDKIAARMIQPQQPTMNVRRSGNVTFTWLRDSH